MDKPISVGDLAIIVRPAPCGCHKYAGMIIRVTEVLRSASGRCTSCGARFRDVGAAKDETRYLTHLSRLKRIPPLEELEGQPTQEDMKEPA